MQGPGGRRQRNAAGMWQQESVQLNETMFSHITKEIIYDITYDITDHDIIVDVVILLVLCDIMFYYVIS